MLRRFNRRIAVQLGTQIYQMNVAIASRTLPQFANTPRNLIIELPRRINNPQCIFLGDNIRLGPGTLLNPVTHYPSPTMKHPEKDYAVQEFDPKIIIGNRVSATGSLTIGAVKEVIIEDDVLLASNIIILDNSHGYGSVDDPYKYQPLSHIAPVLIKKGCWIGNNVVILPGITIGEMSIIGANSVVTSSIPNQCIAFGSPARVSKIWDKSTHSWIAYKESWVTSES